MTTDHPRSRGVYSRTARPPPSAPGSSPLARGLLPASLSDEDNPGIIPARAGFTFSMRLTGTAWRDHPRSRGVYVEAVVRMLRLDGSSPLARGLRRAGRGSPVLLRIIPARAGFTKRWASPIILLPDHPRSRGVYPPNRNDGHLPSGSSPLARGLLLSVDFHTPTRGIIPARAGFTSDYDGCFWDAGDHPRSRGVYPGLLGGAHQPRGSSPLARGLPPFGAAGNPHHRIIPARAGFTVCVT